MNIAICEDLEQDAQRLSDLLTRYREKNNLEFEVTVFSSGDELMLGYEPGRFQILIMDIYMDGLNGMETAKEIRALDADCALIFITTSREHAVEGFSVRAAHYLNKPVEYSHIEEAMNRCREQIERFAKSIELTVGGSPVRLRLRDIRYAEVFRKSCVLHTINGDMQISSGIGDLERMLEGPSFLRCHRSYIVNLNHVRDVKEYYFLMTDGGRALIPIRNYAAMKKVFLEYRFSQLPRP